MNRPIAWISRPVYVVAPIAERRAEPTEHLTYQRIYETHDRPWSDVATVGEVSDAWPSSAEELALKVIVPLLDRHQPSSVDAFVDCRSGAMVGGPAPTYRLALSANLDSATPVCLWGQDGPEFIFGVAAAARQLSSQGTAIVSACQRIVYPDTRAPAWTSLMLGDAAAAVLLRRESFPGSRPVLAVRVERSLAAGSDLLEHTLHHAGLGLEACAWTATADPSRSMGAGGSRWPTTYFGVADILVRLGDGLTDHDLREVGALLTYGRAGTSAAMILGAEEA